MCDNSDIWMKFGQSDGRLESVAGQDAGGFDSRWGSRPNENLGPTNIYSVLKSCVCLHCRSQEDFWLGVVLSYFVNY